MDLGDDAAFEVLHLLGGALHDDAGGRHDRAGDRGERRPSAEAAEGCSDDGEPASWYRRIEVATEVVMTRAAHRCCGRPGSRGPAAGRARLPVAARKQPGGPRAGDFRGHLQRVGPVRDEDDGDTVAAHRGQRRGEGRLARSVEVRVGLVEHDEDRVAVERAARASRWLPCRQLGAGGAELRLVTCGRRRIISCTSARSAARTMAAGSAAWSKRAMFSATVPANSSTSCGT